MEINRQVPILHKLEKVSNKYRKAVRKYVSKKEWPGIIERQLKKNLTNYHEHEEYPIKKQHNRKTEDVL